MLFSLGVPVAFCFAIVTFVAGYLLWGGDVGVRQLILGMLNSVNTFTLVPIPMFVLMGEVMFHSKIAVNAIDGLAKWLGRTPGRLSLLTVGAGTLFSTLSGSSLATAALLGDVLLPEMDRHGYKKPMSLGPVIGSGGIAMMIPPSAMVVFIASLAMVSIGRVLIGIIIPGILLAILYATYIIVRCWLQPSLAPAYEVNTIPLAEKVKDTIIYILPLGSIIFIVIGLIFLGITTPSEAAAMGALGCFILAGLYKKLNWDLVKRSCFGTLKVTGMILMILATASIFSQILAYTQVTKHIVEVMVGLPLGPVVLMIIMHAVLLVMGMFISATAILMLIIPLFMPIALAVGFDPIWFCVTVALNMEMALSTPPFGILLFVVKGVAPSDTTMGDIYRAALPFLLCDLVVLALLIVFPGLVFWLPGIMK